MIVMMELASSGRYYSRRGHGRRYHGRKLHHHHHHKHTYEYYEPSYERVYEKDLDPHDYEDTVFRNDIGGNRVAFDTGSRYGGLDLAAALGLTGVGYVANSGGALHVVG